MFFYTLKKNNKLRVAYIYEVIGLDFGQSNRLEVQRMLKTEETKEFIRVT